MNHDKITALTGRPPTWFRPGTAYHRDVALAVNGVVLYAGN